MDKYSFKKIVNTIEIIVGIFLVAMAFSAGAAFGRWGIDLAAYNVQTSQAFYNFVTWFDLMGIAVVTAGFMLIFDGARTLVGDKLSKIINAKILGEKTTDVSPS
jgi:hypothetical protein